MIIFFYYKIVIRVTIRTSLQFQKKKIIINVIVNPINNVKLKINV